ncbi:MAG: DUF3301 domain-containing protein, partial [Pseudomonadota bacterium]
MTEVLWLCVALAGGGFIFGSLAAREAANDAAKARCQREGLQFLDGTVAFNSIRLVRWRDGIAFQRIFRFEFTRDGNTRLGGFVTTYGSHVDAVDLPP